MGPSTEARDLLVAEWQCVKPMRRKKDSPVFGGLSDHARWAVAEVGREFVLEAWGWSEWELDLLLSTEASTARRAHYKSQAARRRAAGVRASTLSDAAQGWNAFGTSRHR